MKVIIALVQLPFLIPAAVTARVLVHGCEVLATAADALRARRMRKAGW